MPEYRMIFLSDEEKGYLLSMSESIRNIGRFIPSIRSESYETANLYSEVVNRLWNGGLPMPEEAFLTAREREESLNV